MGDAASAAAAAPAPSASWLASLDAVYALFEDPALRAQHAHLAQRTEEAVRLCEEVVRDVGLEALAISYNGGKDCNVLVHLLAAVLRRLSSPASSSSSLPRLPALYVACAAPFAEVERFVAASVARYNLELRRVRSDMKGGLQEYMRMRAEHMGRPCSTVFVGQRRTDPGGASLKPRDPTDPSWPTLERIHPILDWSYADVWAFLRCPVFGDEALRMSAAQRDETATAQAPGVPYCVLYDQGYTSLGSTFNTLPNPVLRLDDADAGAPRHAAAAAAAAPPSALATRAAAWRPAYMLQDERLERAGRVGSSPAREGQGQAG